MISRLKAALAAVIITAGLGLGAVAVWQARTIQALRVEAGQYQHAIDALSASLAASERAAQASAAARRAAQARAAQAQKDLDNALKQDPDWADRPVPDAAAQWLRDNGYAAPAAP